MLTAPTLPLSSTLANASSYFEDWDYDFAAVEGKDGVVGLCTRIKVTNLLGSRYGFSLHARSLIENYLETDCLKVREDEPLVTILKRVFEREEDVYWHDVVVEDVEGRYLGLVKAHTLARLQSQLVSEKMNHLEERREALEKVNSSLSEMTTRLVGSNRELEISRDKEAKAARSKEEFLAVMSHEIRTPLNGIIGMLSLLSDSKLDEDQGELLSTANESAEALLLILNDILDFSRLQAGGVELENREFNVRSLAESVLTLMAENAQESGLEVICSIDLEVPERISSDSGRIRQILANLLGNAVKFTQDGEIGLRLTCERNSAGRLVLLFEIDDTGVGIEPDAQRRLFQPFIQADSSTTRKFGGTGLGLAICKKLVEAMGGEIGLRSEIGKGSTFWFTIVCQSSAKGAEPYNPTRSSDGKVALVFVDNARVAKVLEQELNRRNIKPLLADSIEQCVEIIDGDSTRLDLAIVDAFQWRGELSGRIVATPSIILYPSHGNEIENDAMGKRAHLCKPVRPSQLDRALGIAFGDKNSRLLTLASNPKFSSNDDEVLSGSAGKVLVVEDNAINRRLLIRIVEKMGYECSQAEDGIEALEIWSREKFDIILSDCRMPRMDGYEFARKIRELESEAGEGISVPIIALTANALKGDCELCYAAGMDAYLTKPIKRTKLKETLENVLLSKAKR